MMMFHHQILGTGLSIELINLISGGGAGVRYSFQEKKERFPVRITGCTLHDNNTCRRRRRRRRRPSFDADIKTTETNSAMIDSGDRHKRRKKPQYPSQHGTSQDWVVIVVVHLSTRKIKVQKQTPQ
jgi:hypothetical protein